MSKIQQKQRDDLIFQLVRLHAPFQKQYEQSIQSKLQLVQKIKSCIKNSIIKKEKRKKEKQQDSDTQFNKKQIKLASNVFNVCTMQGNLIDQKKKEKRVSFILGPESIINQKQENKTKTNSLINKPINKKQQIIEKARQLQQQKKLLTRNIQNLQKDVQYIFKYNRNSNKIQQNQQKLQIRNSNIFRNKNINLYENTNSWMNLPTNSNKTMYTNSDMNLYPNSTINLPTYTDKNINLPTYNNKTMSSSRNQQLNFNHNLDQFKKFQESKISLYQNNQNHFMRKSASIDSLKIKQKYRFQQNQQRKRQRQNSILLRKYLSQKELKSSNISLDSNSNNKFSQSIYLSTANKKYNNIQNPQIEKQHKMTQSVFSQFQIKPHRIVIQNTQNYLKTLSSRKNSSLKKQSNHLQIDIFKQKLLRNIEFSKKKVQKQLNQMSYSNAKKKLFNF